jgi:hydrogenase maturation protease
MDSSAPSGSAPEVLILGLGNPLVGDDGIGTRVIQELRALQLPDEVALAEGGTAGMGLVALMEGYRRVYIVDAVDMHQPAGHVACFALHEARFNTAVAPVLPHQLGLEHAIAVAEALGMAPEEVVVIGIQPAQLIMGSGLSQEVEAAIPDVIRSLKQELEGTDRIDLQ